MDAQKQLEGFTEATGHEYRTVPMPSAIELLRLVADLRKSGLLDSDHRSSIFVGGVPEVYLELPKGIVSQALEALRMLNMCAQAIDIYTIDIEAKDDREEKVKRQRVRRQKFRAFISRYIDPHGHEVGAFPISEVVKFLGIARLQENGKLLSPSEGLSMLAASIGLTLGSATTVTRSELAKLNRAVTQFHAKRKKDVKVKAGKSRSKKNI